MAKYRQANKSSLCDHRKTSSRGLGTVEALMSVMGDMQALKMRMIVMMMVTTMRSSRMRRQMTGNM